MLWHKGWLETRFRLLFALAFVGIFLTFQYSVRNSPQGILGIVQFSIPAVLTMVCSLLAGAGIATQPTLAVSKGIHGSTLFTLSLPVSRLRLLAVRASVGWLEGGAVIAANCCALWLSSPALRAMATAGEMFKYAGTLVACASAIYCLSVLLGTFLDDQVRVWCTMMACAVLWWVSSHLPLPGFADIFHAMGRGSPLIAHTVPWNAIAFSLGSAAVLFVAALKIAKSREY
jgi:hypothetical protein